MSAERVEALLAALRIEADSIFPAGMATDFIGERPARSPGGWWINRLARLCCQLLVRIEELEARQPPAPGAP